jgi:hypothetical protein
MGLRLVAAGRVGPRRWGEGLVDDGWAAMQRRVVDLDQFPGYERLTHQIHS